MKKTERLVSDLLDKCGINAPPVPVEVVAEKMGARLSLEPLSDENDISGILYRDDKHIIIGINSKHHPNRRRFSIAHEIGHLVLHKKDLFVDQEVKVDYRDATSSLAIDQKEIQANTFAAELLMPRQFVSREIARIIEKGSLGTKDKLIQDLSKKFKVSEQAMEYRLINLGILVGR